MRVLGEFVKNKERESERTIITLSALARASVVSSTVVLTTWPLISWLVCAIGAIPPNRTLVSDRFMATHYEKPSSQFNGPKAAR